MSADACLELLPLLATGVSGDDAVLAAANDLVAACGRRLLELVGPLQEMLNSQEQRALWLKLPFEVLRVRKAPGDGSCLLWGYQLWQVLVVHMCRCCSMAEAAWLHHCTDCFSC